MKKSAKNDEPNSEIVIYESDDGKPQISVRIENETVWLSQSQLVKLFRSSKANVSEHIKYIFEEGELERNSVVRKFRTTAADGKNYTIEYYDLDIIISLGYRIKSSTRKSIASIRPKPFHLWKKPTWIPSKPCKNRWVRKQRAKMGIKKARSHQAIF